MLKHLCKGNQTNCTNTMTEINPALWCPKVIISIPVQCAETSKCDPPSQHSPNIFHKQLLGIFYQPRYRNTISALPYRFADQLELLNIKHFKYLICWRDGTTWGNATFPSHELLELDHDFSCRTNPRESHKRKSRLNVVAQHWRVPVWEMLGK